MSSPSSAPSVSIAALLKDLPILKLRKDIWENFPVCLEKVGDSTGSSMSRDRYIVRWHVKNLARWSQQIPQYPAITKIRLIRALSANKMAWTVRDAPVAAGDNAICMLEMQLPSERTTALPSNVAALFDSAVIPPVIHTLEDIREHYPVCWTVRSDGAAVLFYHDRQIAKLVETTHYPADEIRGIVHEKLLAGLWNGGWIIDSSNISNNGLGTVSKAATSRIIC
jgi:hypothetical protein